MLLFSGLFFIKSIVNPVKTLADTARNYAKGDFSTRIEKKTDDELGELCDSINYMAQEHITPDTRSIGKVRYSHRGADCTLTPMENGMIKCVFDEPQRAMTPGQAAVFYQDGHVLCGGTIEKMVNLMGDLPI